MRSLFILISLTAGLYGVPSFAAETLVVGKIEAETAHNVILKKIVEKKGSLLLAQVVDREGREQHIFITGDDAVEIKRGLWVIRPGTYQIDI
jgi:hypothetical protein